MAPVDRARIAVRIQPRSSANQILGERAGPSSAAAPMILVRVTAPPVEGKANAALIKLVARTLGLAKSRVKVVQGETGRDKVLEITGMTEAAAREGLLQQVT